MCDCSREISGKNFLYCFRGNSQQKKLFDKTNAKVFCCLSFPCMLSWKYVDASCSDNVKKIKYNVGQGEGYYKLI